MVDNEIVTFNSDFHACSYLNILGRVKTCACMCIAGNDYYH